MSNPFAQVPKRNAKSARSSRLAPDVHAVSRITESHRIHILLSGGCFDQSELPEEAHEKSQAILLSCTMIVSDDDHWHCFPYREFHGSASTSAKHSV